MWIVVDGNPNYYKKIENKYSAMAVRVLLNIKRRDWIYSTNYVIKNFAREGYVIYAGDDIQFERDCIKEAFYMHRDRFPNGDGVVGFNQTNCRGSQTAFGMIGQVWIERFIDRRVFCPDYAHFCSDAELGKYARKLGKFVYCNKAKIKHFRGRDNTRWTGDKLKPKDLPLMKLRDSRGLLWGESFKLIGGKNAI